MMMIMITTGVPRGAVAVVQVLPPRITGLFSSQTGYVGYTQ